MSDATVARPAIRLASIDAYRGAVMLLMMGEVLHFCTVSQALPDSAFWKFLCWHQSHVEWTGCSLHDLIQPSFSFLVGVVLPFSIASRRSRGASFGAMLGHAVIRSSILIVLGILMISLHALPRHLNLKFEDTLTQIGLGYTVVFLLGFCQQRTRWMTLAFVLVGYWLFFALYPLPGPDFDYEKMEVSKDWLVEHGLKGFAAHWQINSNPAAAFDHWFLNLFPREKPFIAPFKGLTTLNFIPLLGTMILGLIAGDLLRSERSSWQKARWLAIWGVVGLASGWALGALGVCPVVKSIWTPSWVLFSGGWCFLFLAGAYILVDIWGQRNLVFPCIVVGTNSIAAYCLTRLFEARATNSLHRVFGWEVFKVFGDAFAPLLYGALVLIFLWSVLFAMYRLKIFVRI